MFSVTPLWNLKAQCDVGKFQKSGASCRSQVAAGSKGAIAVGAAERQPR